MTKNSKEPKLASPVGKDTIEKFKKIHLKPAIKLYAHCVGATFVYVEISWESILIEGSLKVFVDETNEVTSQFSIDDSVMKATATIDIAAVGLHLIDASGEFLAALVPFKAIQISASTGVYIPS
jgi:hypothetical protein